MAVDWPTNFWARQFSAPNHAETPTNAPTPVIAPTPGDDEDIPYHHLPGSGSDPSDDTIGEAVNTLFPKLNGTTVLLDGPKPAGFDTDHDELDPRVFGKWHTAHQIEYLNKEFGSTTPKPTSLVIGPDGNQVTVVISEQPLKIYYVEKLQKADIAKMSTVDQQRVMATDAYDIMAEQSGLTTDRTAIDAVITGLGDLIDDAPFMEEEHKNLFRAQITNLESQLATMTIFSETDVTNQLKELRTRFERAAAFAGTWVRDVSTFGTDPVREYPTQVVDLEGGESLRRAYALFIDQEGQILKLQNERLKIATSAGVDGRALDVPTLVFMLQLNYNLDKQAKITIETEEINQTNSLLKTYAAMQDVMSETLKQYDPGSNSETKGLRLINPATGNQHTNAELAASQYPVITMFEDALAGNAKHPLEILKGITRPTQNFIRNDAGTFEAFKKSAMEIFNGQLQDRVTLINQESQIKMNNINSMDKEKNRHFDLANNSLAKMAEMLQSIARAS